jgi:hypothetical protein
MVVICVELGEQRTGKMMDLMMGLLVIINWRTLGAWETV